MFSAMRMPIGIPGHPVGWCARQAASRVVAWVGDYNNVARSLAEACVLLGADVALACPNGYGASAGELERLNLLGAGAVVDRRRPIDAVDGAIAVHTDTWTSMGQEAEKAERWPEAQ